MNFDKTLENLRCQVDKLDDMFDCPVCFERLSELNVPQCIQGHHLCATCRSMVSKCPICKRSFNGTRNYFVENMIPKLDEIKYSLAILSINRNSLPVANEQKTEPSIIVKGKFYCAVEDCFKSLTFYEMIPHIKKVHKNDFNDVGPVKSNTFSRSWDIRHKNSSSCDEIFYIHNMGIFFAKVDISQKGNVYGHVEMANSNSNANNFYYKLEIGNRKYVEIFQGQVVSTNETHNKSNYVDINDLLRRDDDDDWWFKCTLKITRCDKI